MANWVTPEHLDILMKHKQSYDDASSEKAKTAVLKLIAGKLKESGKKGLPKSLSKV
jgi:hypothetical protein